MFPGFLKRGLTVNILTTPLAVPLVALPTPPIMKVLQLFIIIDRLDRIYLAEIGSLYDILNIFVNSGPFLLTIPVLAGTLLC